VSLERVAAVVGQLPPKLREDVIGYARSVRSALPEIFREAGLAEDVRLGDELVFLAGIRKLHASCSAAFWVLDNSLASLREANVVNVRMGSRVYSRGSPEWRQLSELVTGLERLLDQARLLDLMYEPSYAAVLLELHRGR
jgi:hypothetical protein